MINSEGNSNDLPLMAEEKAQLLFGERHGLEPEASTDAARMALSDRRLIRISGMGSNRNVTFISLEDIQIAEVKTTSRGKRTLLRVALLLAGAVAALLSIDFLPIALPLATALGLGVVYHLHRYLTVRVEGSILFRTGNSEIGLSFPGDMTDQAYAFVNRFSQLKAAPFTVTIGAVEVSEEEQVDAETSRDQRWQEIDAKGAEPMMGPGNGGLLEAHAEGLPPEEPTKKPVDAETTRDQRWQEMDATGAEPMMGPGNGGLLEAHAEGLPPEEPTKEPDEEESPI